MRLFPRLRLEVARQLAEDLSARGIGDARAGSAVAHPETVFAPIGGPISDGELAELQSQVRSLAEEHGYPDSRAQTDLASWDVETAILLHREMDIGAAEAVHAGLWAFTGCVLLPDVVLWRWGRGDSAPVERFLGAQRGIRNTFGRLWWRCEVLRHDGDDGYADVRRILDALGEDQHVQITERPGVASNRLVVRSMAHEWLQRLPAAAVPSEALMRDAAKRVRRRLAFTAYQALTAAEVSREVTRIFDAAVSSLSQGAGNGAAYESDAPPKREDGQSAIEHDGAGPPEAAGAPFESDPTSHERNRSNEAADSAPDLADMDAWERGDIDTTAVRPDIEVQYASGAVTVRGRSGGAVEIADGANLIDVQGPLRDLAAAGGSSLTLSITGVVVGFQRHFLERGVIGLESMSQSQVATYLDVHESTVSRAVGDVFVQTPAGTFPLRFFFSAGIRHRSGKELSVRAVRVALRTIALREPPEHPLSDEEIAAELQAKGLDIARRTVAKYRTILGIPDARGRRDGTWRIT